ncbi:beta strand repeat-containing protein, partial [Campylobacter jejuni]|uniref:beta strand repeat-containing protein n=2 Tax=Campylobacter jejuni TaxID=197 RepID=UPI00345F6605
MKNITLTKTPIEEVKEPCLNSKKIVLSLATISFLASCANAKLNSEIKTYDEVNKNVKTRSASVYSSQSGTSTSINTLQNDTHTISSTGNTLVIGNSGTITISDGGKQAVNFTQGSSTTTFLNQGTLIGGSNAASVQLGANKNNGVTIETFDNQGIIGNGSSKFGITVWGNSDNKSTINNFSNSGTIHSDAGESIYFSNVNISSFANSGTIKSNNGKGVNIVSEVSIENFANSGTITSNSIAIDVANNSNINYFTNSGFISAGKGVNIGQGSMTNFTNASGGTIQGTEAGVLINTKIDTFTNNGFINSIGKSAQWSNGVWVSGNTNVKTFVNNGIMQGDTGAIRSSGGTIENFINNGIMNSGYTTMFIQNSIIKTLENKGTINTTQDISWGAAIKLEEGGTIENIINTGTINSITSGIYVSYGRFETLTIKDGGIVYGKTAGIRVGQWQSLGDLYIDGTSSKKDGTVSGIYSDNFGISLDESSKTQKIELKNGGVIKGNISGIRLDNGASLSGEMILSGEGSRVEGGSGSGISNQSGKIEGSIKVEDGATVTSSSGQAISNSGSGSITGGITVSGENTKLEGNIINTGNASIGSDIKIEGGAKVEGGLVNEGSASITGAITIESGSKLDSITNTSTSDTGISGSITNNSDNKLEISNSGNIGGKIESTGAADMVISNNGGGTISGGISSSGSGNTSISNSQGSTINNGITVSGSAQVEISNQGSVGKDENGNTVTNNGSGSVGIKDWVVS